MTPLCAAFQKKKKKEKQKKNKTKTKKTGFVVINEIAKKQNKNLMARFRLLYYYFNTVYEQNLSDQFFQMKWEIVE